MPNDAATNRYHKLCSSRLSMFWGISLPWLWNMLSTSSRQRVWTIFERIWRPDLAKRISTIPLLTLRSFGDIMGRAKILQSLSALKSLLSRRFQAADFYGLWISKRLSKQEERIHVWEERKGVQWGKKPDLPFLRCNLRAMAMLCMLEA